MNGIRKVEWLDYLIFCIPPTYVNAGEINNEIIPPTECAWPSIHRKLKKGVDIQTEG